MTGRGRRNKGASAERELARLLSDHLGASIIRNLEQSRSGGADLLGVGAFALEVKRQESLSLGAWWQQAVDQAKRSGMKPALAYRQSRRPWKIVFEIGAVNPDYQGQPFTVETCIGGFCLLVRETL